MCTVQGWAKEWSLGCVIPASWLPLAAGGEFTQPTAHLLADPCMPAKYQVAGLSGISRLLSACMYFYLPRSVGTSCIVWTIGMNETGISDEENRESQTKQCIKAVVTDTRVQRKEAARGRCVCFGSFFPLALSCWVMPL